VNESFGGFDPQPLEPRRVSNRRSVRPRPASGAEKTREATQSHLRATNGAPASHPQATLMLPSGYPQATLKPPQSVLKTRRKRGPERGDARLCFLMRLLALGGLR